MDSLEAVAVIPAYRPGPVLIDLLKELTGDGFICVVVDDGSGPTFEERFAQAARYAIVLTHEVNRGKGRALKTALAHLAAEGWHGTVVTLDADGQHCPNDVVRVWERARRSPEALVLGSRAIAPRTPLRSKLGNRMIRWAYRMSTGCRVQDTQTGLRSFSAAWIPQMLEIPGDRFEYEMNVLLAFAREGRQIIEVEISTIYIDGNSGSHFDPVRDSWRICRELLKFSGSSVLSFLIDYGFYTLLSLVTADLGNAGLVWSNVGARAVSAGVNYAVNRKLVFQSSAGLFRSGTEYFLLAALILVGNTWLLKLLVDAGLNRYLAKLLAELFFFTLSWAVQRTLIFRRGRAAAHETPDFR